MPQDYATIKLPKDLMKQIRFDIYNHTGLGDLRVQQEKPQFIDGKWRINIYLLKVDEHLHLRKDDRPGA